MLRSMYWDTDMRARYKGFGRKRNLKMGPPPFTTSGGMEIRTWKRAIFPKTFQTFTLVKSHTYSGEGAFEATLLLCGD